MKPNLHNLFLSRSLRRGKTAEGKLLSNNKSLLHSKGSMGSFKYKGLNYILGNSSLERKPVFRITSMSKAKLANKKTEPVEKREEASRQVERLKKNHFSYQMVIGKGGFGKVWIVEQKSSRKYYALKEMSKAKIVSKRSVHSVMNERNILSSHRHDFIVNMKYAFQNRENLYLVMDLLTGGDLRFHICYHRRFSEEQTRFFAACIVEGLAYIHKHGILHRDIKPENLVFEENGYLRITDFGIARKWSPENGKETSGTPGYMAPEVMCRNNHNIQVDYFALGVICFECMKGRRPYVGRSRKEIRDQILAKQVRLRKDDVSKGWSLEAADFINGLIQRKPNKRLGANGPDELKNHPWMKDYPWGKLTRKEIVPPFKPNVRNVFEYAKHLTEEDTDPSEHQKGAAVLRKSTVQELFGNYYFEEKRKRGRGRHSTHKSKSKHQEGSKRKHVKVKSLNSSHSNLYKIAEMSRKRKKNFGLEIKI